MGGGVAEPREGAGARLYTCGRQLSLLCMFTRRAVALSALILCGRDKNPCPDMVPVEHAGKIAVGSS